MKSLNARRAVPADLLRQLWEHVEGVLLWVPVRVRRRDKTRQLPQRDEQIRKARVRGELLRVLAARYGISVNRVSEVCAGIHVGRRGGRRRM